MSTDSQIDAVLYRFDFAKVSKAMRALDWTWGTTAAGDDRVPLAEDIRTVARQKLAYVAQPNSSGYISSGGLTARRHPDGGLSLAFEVESAYAK